MKISNRNVLVFLLTFAIWLVSLGILFYDQLNVNSALFATLIIAIFGFVLRLSINGAKNSTAIEFMVKDMLEMKEKINRIVEHTVREEGRSRQRHK